MDSPKGIGVVSATLEICLGQPRFESACSLVRKQQLVSDSVDGNGGVSPTIKFIICTYIITTVSLFYIYIFVCIYYNSKLWQI